MSNSNLIGRLHELIAALDGRRPQKLDVMEAKVRQESQALRARAVKRLADLVERARRG